VTDTLYRIGDAAAFVNRSVETIRRWEQEGRIPQARRVGNQRRYSEDDLRKLKEIAERPLPTEEPTSSPQPWAETEAETVTPWAETGGTTEIRQKRLDALPTTCITCWRSLVRHGVTRPNGQRVLIASCEVHGEQGRQRWT
jgi:excisionase family DNA binding protein